MKFGFDVSNASAVHSTGITRYMQEIVSCISKKIGKENIRLFYKLSRIREFKECWRPSGFNTRFFYKSYWPVQSSVNLLHGLDGTVPNWRNTIKIVTIHDLAAIKLDSDDISTQKFRAKKLKNYIKTVKAADAVIADSESTKKDIMDILNVNENKIFVCHLGVDEKFHPRGEQQVAQMKKKYGLEKDYLLFIGAVSGRKNTRRLVQAYANSLASKSVDLVLVGGKGYQYEKTMSAIKENKLEHCVKLPGYISDHDIPALYTGALGFAFPTIYEGFGLPLLEAMACGTPVMAGNIGSAPEITGKQALHVDPYDVDAITRGIDQLVSLKQDKDALTAHAQKFTWQKCAAQTLDIYRQVADFK